LGIFAVADGAVAGDDGASGNGHRSLAVFANTELGSRIAQAGAGHHERARPAGERTDLISAGVGHDRSTVPDGELPVTVPADKDPPHEGAIGIVARQRRVYDRGV